MCSFLGRTFLVGLSFFSVSGVVTGGWRCDQRFMDEAGVGDGRELTATYRVLCRIRKKRSQHEIITKASSWVFVGLRAT